MSRMTKTRTPDEYMAERLSIEADLCRNETATDVADLLDDGAACIRTLRAKVAGLEQLLNEYKDAECRAVKNQGEALAQLTALPKWAQSSESKGQFYRKSIQEMAALREQLTALREGLGGLLQECHREARERVRTDEGYCINGAYQVIAKKLETLITQPTPTDNSAKAVNGGEDNETPQQFTASLIEKRGEHFAARVMEALEDAL